MSPQAITAQIRDEVRSFRRHERFTDQADYLERKDAHCRRVEVLLNDLMRAIGTPVALSIVPGARVLGRRSVQVVMRDRPARRA